MAESAPLDSSDKIDDSNNEFNVNQDNPLEQTHPPFVDDEYEDASASIEGSVVASPSIESFSTLPEGESSLSLADGGAAADLVVRVDNPQKQSDLLETYITFRVSTKTSRQGYEASAYCVRHRYNDFVWLRQHLVHAFPTHFVPALPVKHTIMGQLDRYGREFVTARVAALQVFLNRLVAHPILSFAPCFKCFLTATTEEFHDLRRLTTGGLLSKVSDSWKSLSTLHIEAHRPLELTKLYDYLGNLSEKLNNFCRINQRIHREREEQGRELRELKPLLEKWAGSDPDLNSLLCAVANAVDKCQNALHSVLLDNDNLLVNQPLKEYVLYIEAIKGALERRDELEVELIYRKEVLERRQSELVAAQQDGGEASGLRAWVKTFESKEDRLRRHEQNVANEQLIVEETKDKVDCANANIRADSERWAQERQADLKSILLAFADQHINFYQQSGEAWDAVLSDLEQSSPSSNSRIENIGGASHSRTS